MAKKKINFKTADGMKPRKNLTAGGGFSLRVPLTVTIPPNTESDIRLGLTCDLPLLVIHGDKVSLIAPGKDITIKMQAKETALSFGEGEVVAVAYAIDNTDVELA